MNGTAEKWFRVFSIPSALVSRMELCYNDLAFRKTAYTCGKAQCPDTVFPAAAANIVMEGSYA